MLRLGKGTSIEERRVERAIILALQNQLEFESASVNYAQIVGPVASPMHSGIDAEGWHVKVSDKISFFLKLYNEDAEHLLDLDTSFRAADIAAKVKIAPKLFWKDIALGAAMWEYKGPGWRTAIFDDSWNHDVVPHVSSAMLKLHSSPLIGRPRNVFKTLQECVFLAQEKAINLPSDFDWMLSNVQEIQNAIFAAGVDLCVCHGDLIASNFMIGPGNEVLLVDWDEACDSDPYWDLGMYMVEAFPFDEPALAMIENYAGHADRKLLARARLYSIAGDLTWAVRSLIRAKQSHRTDIEYFKYAQWRALRCRVALHDPKFEQMLRSL